MHSNEKSGRFSTLETCVQCHAKFKSKAALHHHNIQTKHDIDIDFLEPTLTDLDTTLSTCIHCNATFKSKVSLDDHIIRKHPDFITSVTRKIFECAECYYKTSIKNNFKNHMSVHGFNYRLDPCSHCNATFKSKVSLDDHILKKHPEFVTSITRKIYKCSKCVYQTTVKNHFNDHMSVHPETKRRECLHCDSSFTSRMALDNHVVKKHPDFITSVTSKLYECTECHYKTTMKHDFNRHTSMHQGTTPSYSVTCAHCNVKLKSKRALDDHVIRKHPDFVTSVSRKIHECSMCSYKTLHKSSFDKHMTTHTETTSKCIHCNATFKSRASLDDHTLRKHPDFIATITRKIYECINCIYKTTIKSHFNKHMSVHTENGARALDDHVVKKHPNDTASVSRKIHECTKCSYKTIFRHPKIASSYEPKACVHCNATFKRKLWLDDHVVRKHVDFMSSVTSKLHECTKCSYKTVRKKLLVRHFLTHSYTAKSYSESCVHCNAKYQQRISLDDHIIKKHPEFITSVTRKIYECTQCVYKSLRKKSFVKHMSRHPEAVPGDSLNRCVHCNATLRSKRALDDHVVRKHPDSAAPVGRKILECTECRFKTVLKGSLAQHMLTHFKAYNL
nr:unnamed protein product [Callosobruchus chinensis]